MASQQVARTERRVAERACATWAVLEASPAVQAMEDVPVGAFRLTLPWHFTPKGALFGPIYGIYVG